MNVPGPRRAGGRPPLRGRGRVTRARPPPSPPAPAGRGTPATTPGHPEPCCGPLPLSHLSVDEFPHDVRVTGMPVGLRDHVHEGPVQRQRGPRLPRSSGHPADRVERKGPDRLVGVGPDPAVRLDDPLARLLGGRPHVRVGLGVAGDPEPGRTGEGPPEGLSEVEHLGTGDVLHEAQEIGAGGGHGAADAVLREAVQLPQEGVAGVLDVEPQIRGEVREGHRAILLLPPRPGTGFSHGVSVRGFRTGLRTASPASAPVPAAPEAARRPAPHATVRRAS